MTHRLRAAALARAACITSLCAVLAACGTISLYNEARDKQAQELAGAAEKIDLVAVVDGVKSRFSALSEVDVDTRTKNAELRRELEVAVFAGDSAPLQSSYVDRFLDSRMKKLTGSALSPAAWRAYSDGLIRKEVSGQFSGPALRRFGESIATDVATCEDLTSFAANDGALQKDYDVHGPRPRLLYDAAKKWCDSAMKDITPVPVAPESQIAERLKALKAATLEQAKRALAMAAAKQQVKAAKDAYDAAVKDATPNDGKTYLEKVTAAADRLNGALESISKNDKIKSAALQVVTEENIKSLEAITTVVASGETDLSSLDPSQKRAVAVLRGLPTMADEADRLLKEAQRPRVAPLMLSLDQQRLLLEGMQQEQKLQDAQVTSLREALDLSWQEFHSLGRARYLLEPDDTKTTVPLNQSLVQVIATRDSARLYALYSSLAEYFDRSQLLRIQADRAQLAASSYIIDREMLRSKYAALQWQKLINDMAGVLAEYHKSGIKPAEIAEFAKALGLFYIGNQTGK